MTEPVDGRNIGAAQAVGPRSGRGIPTDLRRQFAVPRSSRFSFKHGDPHIALEPQSDRRIVLRVVEYPNHVVAEQARRHWRAKPSEKGLRLDPCDASVSFGALPTDACPADHLHWNDRLKPNAEALLLGDPVGVFGHQPKHSLRARITARQGRALLRGAARAQ